jgi:hypothetical protein
MSFLDDLKSRFLAVFLDKASRANPERPVKQQPEPQPEKQDTPLFIDHYAERLNDPAFREFDRKVMGAVRNIRVGFRR